MNYSEACAQLGLDSTVELTDSSLKKAFKKAALKHHPDKNLHDAEQAKETFQRISTAYEFLNQCVTRGQTGPNKPRFATSDNPLFEGDGDPYDESYHYYYDDDDEDDVDEEYYDVQDILFSMLFAKMHGGGSRGGVRGAGGGGGGGGFGFSMGGSTFFVPGRASYSAGTSTAFHHRSTTSSGSSTSTPHRHSYAAGAYSTMDHGYYGGNYYAQHEEDDDDDDDDDLEDMFNAFAEQARRKEEARQAARKREKEHAQYMAERARQAELEGRDFFESWNVKQLMGECTRRGIAMRGKQQKDIIEALIQDEAKKRLRVQLKQEAPLLDEWAEVIHMKKNAEWNGMKVRVIDYFGDLGKYLVEWDMNASKKKTKGHTRESKTARIKPENLRLWGTGEPTTTKEDSPSAATASSTGSDKENNKQDHQQQQPKKKSKNNTSNSNGSSNSNQFSENNGKTTPKKETKKPTVPEVPETKCCAICYKEHDLEADDDGKPKRVIIHPCAHIFCVDCCCGSYLPDATSTVEIRSCRICHRCDPGMNAIKVLPYITDLQDPPETLLELLYKEYSLIVTCESVEALEKQQEKEVEALDLRKAKSLKQKKDAIFNKANHGKMNKDKKGKLYKQVQANVEAEFGPKRNELLRKHEQQWRSVGTTETLKELHEQRDTVTEEVTNAIAKHYRRASIKVHPDRHGDKFQKEFDALTNAKNTLSNVELRHNYMEQMLQIVCTVGTHWIPSSHKSWVDKHQPDMAEQNPTTKKSDAPGYKAPLQLEGGLMHTKPRKPNVAILNTTERRVRVTLRIPGSSYEFYSHVTALHVLGERADVYNEEFEEEFKKTVNRNGFNSKCEGEIEVDMTLPEAGMWDIRWKYTLEMEPGCFHESERSADATVDLVSPKFKAQLKVMKSFESLAARRTNEIHAALRKLKNTTGDHANIENRYETLQEATLKAKHTEFHLEKAMKSVGANMTASDTPLALLRSALTETRPYKEELDQAMVIHKKKVAYKNFKQGVYDVLETGEGSAWVAVVTEETLKDEMKGDANRLYQLLMEGKKAYNLDLVDAATLCVAADRKDLFSPKQLKALCDRSEAVEIRAGEEARRIMIENEKKESVEKQRQSLQERAAQMDCNRGDLVQIEGLKSEPALNGRLATYLSPSWTGERYNLKLDEGREISLRKHNFRKYDGVSTVNFGPAPVRKQERWACKACTYVHEGADVERLTECSMCGTPRDIQVNEPEKVAQGTLSQPKLSETQTREEPHPVRSQTPLATPSTKQPILATKPAPRKTDVQGTPKQTSLPSMPTSQRTTVAMENQSQPSHEKRTTAHAAQQLLQKSANVSHQRPAPSARGSVPTHTAGSKTGTQGVNLAMYVTAPEKVRPQNAEKTPPSPRRSKNDAIQTSDTDTTTERTPPRKNVARRQDSVQTTPVALEPPSHAPVTPSQDSTHKKLCKRGKNCRYLLQGNCRYEHTAEEIAAVKEAAPSANLPSRKPAASKKAAPATPATIAESLNTNRASVSTGSSRSIEMTVLVDSKAAGFVIGKGWKNLKAFSKRSGAKLSAGKRDSTEDGMCHIQIRGSSQEMIDKAAAMVHARLDQWENRKVTSKSGENGRDVTSTESSSISTVPSVINGAVNQAPSAQMPSSSNAKDASNLAAFLESHSKALKCAPDVFLAWLNKEDIETLADLSDALEDEYFLKELLRAGLKRFKMMAFTQSLQTMLGKSD